jgi:hypothetical protein
LFWSRSWYWFSFRWNEHPNSTTTTTQKYGLFLGSGTESSSTYSELLMGVGTGESTMTTNQVGTGGVIMGVGGLGDTTLDSIYNAKSGAVTEMGSGSSSTDSAGFSFSS